MAAGWLVCSGGGSFTRAPARVGATCALVYVAAVSLLRARACSLGGYGRRARLWGSNNGVRTYACACSFPYSFLSQYSLHATSPFALVHGPRRSHNPITDGWCIFFLFWLFCISFDLKAAIKSTKGMFFLFSCIYLCSCRTKWEAKKIQKLLTVEWTYLFTATWTPRLQEQRCW
jgi:hypothetical protein